MQRNLQVFLFDDQEDVVRSVEYDRTNRDVQQWVQVAQNKQAPVETVEMEGVEEDLVFDLMTKKVHVVRHKKSNRVEIVKGEKPKSRDREK